MAIREITPDLVLEIISFLPLKFAIQCTILSKNFRHLISDDRFAEKLVRRSPEEVTSLFHASLFDPVTYHRIDIPNLDHDPDPAALNCPGARVTLPQVIRVWASSNGLLLLHFRLNTKVWDEKALCVTNPITKACQFIADPMTSSSSVEHAGLAVDRPSSSSLQYKVVTVSEKCPVHTWYWQKQHDRRYYEFRIFSPETNFWGQTITSSAYNYGSELVLQQATYFQGCFHWLRARGDILTFDPNTKQSGIIEKPTDLEVGPKVPMWLGEAQGKITLISISEEGMMVIWNLCEGERWIVRNQIRNSATPRNDGRPVLFYGDRVYGEIHGEIRARRDLVAGKKRAPGNAREIYEYDDLTTFNEKRKIGIVSPYLDANQFYAAFAPTLAKVSTVDHISEDIRQRLRKEITDNVPEAERTSFSLTDEDIRQNLRKIIEMLSNLLTSPQIGNTRKQQRTNI